MRHGGNTDPSSTCHPDDGAAGPSSLSQILDNRTDNGSIVDMSVGLWAHDRALQYLTRWLSAVAWQSCQHRCSQLVSERIRQWGSNICGTAQL